MQLSIIIVNYNTAEFIKGCVNSIIKRVNNLDYEIIVVDNASTDASLSLLRNFRRRLKNFKLIENKENLGFGRANNKGLALSKGKYVLFLNSDTLLMDSFFPNLILALEKNPNLGALSVSLRNPDGSLQLNGGYFPNLFRVFTWMFLLDHFPIISSLLKPFHHYPKIQGESFFNPVGYQVDWVTGAFLMGKRDIFKKIGGFDEDFFMYAEDLDICFRVKREGFDVMLFPDYFIIHFGGKSSNSEFPIIAEYNSIKIFFKKHGNIFEYPLILILLYLGAFIRLMLFTIIGRRTKARAYAKILFNSK